MLICCMWCGVKHIGLNDLNACCTIGTGMFTAHRRCSDSSKLVKQGNLSLLLVCCLRAVLCCAVLCCAVLCCAVLCCAAHLLLTCCSLAVLCCGVPCCAVPCRAVLCCAVLCRAVLCCADAVLCSATSRAAAACRDEYIAQQKLEQTARLTGLPVSRSTSLAGSGRTLSSSGRTLVSCGSTLSSCGSLVSSRPQTVAASQSQLGMRRSADWLPATVAAAAAAAAASASGKHSSMSGQDFVV